MPENEGAQYWYAKLEPVIPRRHLMLVHADSDVQVLMSQGLHWQLKEVQWMSLLRAG